MKLHRFALFAGLLAVGASACGDDVVVAPPTEEPPPALIVSMSPQNQQILVGQTADFTVNFSGGVEGAPVSWTCTSGNAAFVGTAVVTATGCRVTGAAAGSTTVTAVITKGTQSATAGGQVTVSAIPNEPATVVITQVTQGGTTAQINAIRGQLDVTMTITRNDETPQRLRLFLDGVEVASQVFAPAVAAEGAAEQAVQIVELSFLTDRYVGMFAGEPVTGVPYHLNGLRTLSASLDVVERPGDPRASNTIQINLANFDRLHVSEVGGGATQTKLPTLSAFDAVGNIWYGGPTAAPAGNVTFTAVPVMYSGRTVAFLSMALGGGAPGGCGTSGILAAAPFTFTYTCAGTQTAVAGIAPTVASAQATDGNPITFGGVAFLPVLNIVPAIVGPHPFPVRIDKVAPSGAQLAFVTSNGNRENWGNAAYALTSGYLAPGDAGVGLPAGAPANGDEREFQIRTGTTVVAGHDFSDDPQTLAALANSVNNSTYNMRVRVSDRLTNSVIVGQTVATIVTPPNFVAQCAGALCELTASSATSHVLATFGRDGEAPLGMRTAISPGALPNALTAVLNVPVGNENFEFSATDVISGFAAAATPVGSRALFNSHIRVNGTPLSATLTRVNLIGTGSISTTPFALSAAATGFVNSSANSASYTQTPTSITTAPISVPVSSILSLLPQYEIYQAQARDKAGNLTAIIPWQVYVNQSSVPVFTGLVAQGSFLGGAQVLFPGSAQDPVEVYQGSFDLGYPGIGFLVYERPNPIVDPLFNDVISLPANVNFQTGAAGTPLSFIRGLEGVTVDGGTSDGAPLLTDRVTGHAPVAGPGGFPLKPNLLTGRTYNGTLEMFANPTFPCHVPGAAAVRPCHITNLAPASDGTVGASGHASAPIISTSVQTGSSFTAYPAAVAIANFYIASYTVSAVASGNRTATVRIRARGPTGTFVNPFPKGLVVVENIGALGGDPYLRPITGTLTPAFTSPFPTLDNGSYRDYDWTFTFTLPTLAAGQGILADGTRRIHAIGLSDGHDGLVSRQTVIPFSAAGILTGTTAVSPKTVIFN